MGPNEKALRDSYAAYLRGESVVPVFADDVLWTSVGAPNRIDILTGISGVTWQDAWASRTQVHLDGIEIQVIGKRELIRNKQATGRPQDLADLDRLRQEMD